jgi:uncharacterized membrane protein YeaQ/YmgE (transglycosylase-associated protein family)
MSIFGFILFLIVAAICACIANALVPGRIPGGYFVAVMCGVLGAWIGGSLLGHFGPSFAGISILPTIIGSAILVSGLAFFSRASRGAPV